MKKKLVTLLLAVVVTGLFAETPARIKIDIDGRTEKIICGDVKTASSLKSSNPQWLETALRPYYLIVESSKDITDQWEEFEFAFTPDKSGVVNLNLRGVWTQKNVVRWIGYDHFRISGAKLENPSFEQVNGEIVTSWKVSSLNQRLNRKDAGEGKNYLDCAHDFIVSQGLSVTAKKPVTIRFLAKKGPETDRPSRPVVQVKKPAGHPKSYYRYYDAQVKLLPLKDKGISPGDIKFQAPGRKIPPLPESEFAIPSDPRIPAIDSVKVPVELLEEDGVARTAAVRFGFPVPEKTVYNLNNLRVLAPDGKEVSAQFSVTAWWPDRSIKWILIQFQAALKADEKVLYQVELGKNVKPAAMNSPLRWEENADTVTVYTGPLKAVIDKKKFNLLNGVWVGGKYIGAFSQDGLSVSGEDQRLFAGSAVEPRRVRITENGPQRLTIQIDGQYGSEAIGSYTVRLGFQANSPVVLAEVTHVNTNLSHEFTDISSLNLRFRPVDAVKKLTMDGHTQQVPARFFQENDQILNIDGRKLKERLSGAGILETASGCIGIAVRDAALRYPKAFRIQEDCLVLELLPELPSAKFGTELPHYLQYPFCEGKYRMKWGMSFTEHLAFDFSGNADIEELAAAELVPVVSRDWLARCAVFQGVPPENDKMFADWDEEALKAFQMHMQLKERQREYGFLNYGDSFGERGRNWTNNEYDLAHGLFMLFARTGNRDAFRWAVRAAQHQADVDIVHAYPDPFYLGANAQHGIGHTGVSYQIINPATWSYRYDVSYWGSNGHTWSDGMLDAWSLTGNARIMDSALKLGEHLTNYTAPLFTRLGTHERSAGWSLKAIIALYRTTGNRKYLDAARRIAGIAMKEQRFDKGGAWPHKMPPDHSGGFKDTFGNCPYLIGILTEGLRQYYLATGASDVVPSLIAAANWQRRTWDDTAFGWPYAASWDNKPYFPAKTGLNPLVAPGMMTGGRMEKNAEIFEISKKVMAVSTLQGLSAIGKSLAIELCLIPGLMDEIRKYQQEHPDAVPYRYTSEEIIKLFGKQENPQFRLRAPDHKEFIVFLTGDNPEILITRQKHGSRPKFKPECTYRIVDPAGKTVAEASLPTTEPYRGKHILKGKKGDSFKILIEDDMTGIWSIVPGERHQDFAVLTRDSSIGNSSVSSFYLTVPAGTKEFKLNVTGVHSGGFKAWLIRPDGSLGGSISGNNTGMPRLPWLKYEKELNPRQTLTLRLAPPETTEIWHLLLYAGGDLALGVQGIPSVISLTPVAFPGK